MLGRALPEEDAGGNTACGQEGTNRHRQRCHGGGGGWSRRWLVAEVVGRGGASAEVMWRVANQRKDFLMEETVACRLQEQVMVARYRPEHSLQGVCVARAVLSACMRPANNNTHTWHGFTLIRRLNQCCVPCETIGPAATTVASCVDCVCVLHRVWFVCAKCCTQ